MFIVWTMWTCIAVTLCGQASRLEHRKSRYLTATVSQHRAHALPEGRLGCPQCRHSPRGMSPGLMLAG